MLRLFSIMVVITILVPQLAHSDDIFLRNGYAYRNVLVIDTVDNKITVQLSSGRIQHYPLTSIGRIVKSPLDPSKESVTENQNSDDLKNVTQGPGGAYGDLSGGTIRQEHSNLKLLPLGILSFGLAWDFFCQVSDINDNINTLKKLGGQTDQLESQKDRKMALGIVSFAVGIATTNIALTPVEVLVTPGSVSLSYRF